MARPFVFLLAKLKGKNRLFALPPGLLLVINRLGNPKNIHSVLTEKILIVNSRESPENIFLIVYFINIIQLASRYLCNSSHFNYPNGVNV